MNTSRLVPITAVFSFFSLAAFAGRPLAINDSATLGDSKLQIETGVGYESSTDCDHFEWPFCVTYGIGDSVEIGAGFGEQYEHRFETGDTWHNVDGISDVVIGGKWRIAGPYGQLTGIAISPSVSIPTADSDKGLGSGETDYDLTLIASFALADSASLHLNCGYAFIGEPEGEDAGDILHYGVAADYQLFESIQLAGEICAEKELLGGTDTAVHFNAGLRWAAMDGLTLDLAAGSKIAGDTPDFTATAGLTWVMDFAKQEPK